MRRKNVMRSALALLLAVATVAAGVAAAQSPEGTEPEAVLANLGTAFTYQGRLVDAGAPAAGVYDLQFRLYDAAAGGVQIGATQPMNDVAVAGGLFTATLDFGAGAFNGLARWLEIDVKRDADAGYTTLLPRVALSPAPHALALPGLWTQQNATSPNLIGGYAGNVMGAGVAGGVIGGGGYNGFTNRVFDNYGSVGGGANNVAGVDEGYPSFQNYATVAGGSNNAAIDYYATVAGGSYNTASEGHATVGGGQANSASGFISTVGGGNANTASGDRATVSGGAGNDASGGYATVAGGTRNLAAASYATVSGGGPVDNSYPFTSNRVYDDFGTVAGGGDNVAGVDDSNSTNQTFATVGGGANNTASGSLATVGGGESNSASAGHATIGGGRFNSATGGWATVAGGRANSASAQYAFVGGGLDNEVTASYGAVPGGRDNTAAGQYSLAAGRRAQANHDGAFVWADSTDSDFSSPRADTFSVRAANGGRISTSSSYNALEITNGGSGGGLVIQNTGSGSSNATIRANNALAGNGVAADFTNDSDLAAVYLTNSGTGEVLYLRNGGNGVGTGGGDFIRAVGSTANWVQFLVTTDGAVFSDVGFFTPAADFAEMLPATAGLEPGDVLAIGPDGQLVRTAEAYQSTVVGVYSTRPGFVGGMPMEGEAPGKVPLAVVGVVPVKASAEGGLIQPGDLLAASSTPGHAMKAKPDAPQGTVIGKALEPLVGDSGVILMLVILQ